MKNVNTSFQAFYPNGYFPGLVSSFNSLVQGLFEKTRKLFSASDIGSPKDRPSVAKVVIVVPDPFPQPPMFWTTYSFTLETGSDPDEFDLPISLQIPSRPLHNVSGDRSVDGQVVTFTAFGKTMQDPRVDKVRVNHSNDFDDNVRFQYLYDSKNK